MVESRSGNRCGTIFHNLALNLGVLVTSQHILACYHDREYANVGHGSGLVRLG